MQFAISHTAQSEINSIDPMANAQLYERKRDTSRRKKDHFSPQKRTGRIADTNDGFIVAASLLYVLVSVGLVTCNAIALSDMDAIQHHSHCTMDRNCLNWFFWLSVTLLFLSFITLFLTLDLRMPRIQKFKGIAVLNSLLIVFSLFTASLVSLVLVSSSSDESCSSALTHSILLMDIWLGLLFFGLPLALLALFGAKGDLSHFLTTKRKEYVQLTRPSHIHPSLF